jgi:hypothetical protein
MSLHDLKFKLTGMINGGRGLRRDVETMQLSINESIGLRWKPDSAELEF